MTWWWEGMCWGMKSEVGRELWYEPSDFRFNRWDCTFHPTYNVLCSCLVVKLPPALLWPHGLQPTRLLCPWNFPGKNTGLGCRFLLQGIFATQGSTHTSCIGKQILYCCATWEAQFTKELQIKNFLEIFENISLPKSMISLCPFNQRS